MGVSPRRRGIRANESLAIIQGLLRGEAVSFSGQAFEIDNAVIRPTPSIPIPILVGGRSDAALTRTARFGDGWIGVWCSVKRYAQAVAKIETEAVLMGRPGMDWCHGYQPWVGVDWQSATTAKAVVKSGMEAFYKIPFEQFERYTPSGTPLEVATQLAPYVQAGCKMFNLKVCAKHPEEEVALGAAVVEHLKGLVAAG